MVFVYYTFLDTILNTRSQTWALLFGHIVHEHSAIICINETERDNFLKNICPLCEKDVLDWKLDCKWYLFKKKPWVFITVYYYILLKTYYVFIIAFCKVQMLCCLVLPKCPV